MRRTRTQLAHGASATLLLFFAAVAAPRTGFFVHSHRGGEHEHVHAGAPQTGDADLDRALADAVGPAHHHAHPHRPRLTDAPVVGRSDSATTAAAHWHAQRPFQRALAPHVAALDGTVPVAAMDVAAPQPAAGARIRRTHARAPPLA